MDFMDGKIDKEAIRKYLTEHEDGKALLEELKAPLLAKRDELLEEVKSLSGRFTESATKVNDLSTLLAQERGAVQRLVVDDALDRFLTRANVLPDRIETAKAILKGRHEITVNADGVQRKAVVGERTLEDVVREWSESDEARHFVAAAQNSGGGARGSGGYKPSPASDDQSYMREKFTRINK